MVEKPRIEPWMEALVEVAVQRAVLRYEGGVPGAALDEMRRLVRLRMYNDPEAQRLLRAMAPAPPPEDSDKHLVGGLLTGVAEARGPVPSDRGGRR